jgi:general secretion pathway protein J
VSVSNPIKNAEGFTLLELLIAITVFAILSTIAYSGLDIVLDTEARTTKHIDQLSQLQKAFSLMLRDIEQVTDREVRDEFGDPLLPMRSGGFSGELVEFTRGGRPNPMDLQRSNLQRIGYQLDEGVLYRIYWPQLDRAQEVKPIRTPLIDDIESVQLVFFDRDLKSQETWPPELNNQDASESPSLPRGLAITLETRNLGEIRRVFRLAETPPATKQSNSP